MLFLLFRIWELSDFEVGVEESINGYLIVSASFCIIKNQNILNHPYAIFDEK